MDATTASDIFGLAAIVLVPIVIACYELIARAKQKRW